MEFSATISVVTHGTHKLTSYRLTNDEVRVIEFSTNAAPPKTVVDRPLSAAENERLQQFVRSFSLDGIKEKYQNERVEGEIHFEYELRLGKQTKNVYVYFRKPADLKGLNEQVNLLIPETHHLW